MSKGKHKDTRKISYSGALIVEFENSLLLFLSVSIVDFEQVHLCWVGRVRHIQPAYQKHTFAVGRNQRQSN